MTSKSKAKPRLSGRMLPIMHPDAAGIDIGAEEIFVSVPPDRDIDSVRRFDTFTRDLFALADWLRQCNIRSVAMESTGSTGFRFIRYWKRTGSKSSWLTHIM